MVAILRGQPAAWARFEADARRTDAERGSGDPPLDDSVTSAWLNIALRGQPARGVAELDALLARAPLRSLPIVNRPYFEIAKAYAVAGRPDRARAVLSEYSADVKDSAVLRDFEPDAHDALGEIALAEHRPRDALREFVRGDTAADGQPTPCAICFPLAAARAYDAAGNSDSAIAMYERYEAVPARDPNITGDPWFRPLAYKRLGELYENKGDTTRAATNYRQFVSLWKDADPDLQPVVSDARRRLAKLGGERAHDIPTARAVR